MIDVWCVDLVGECGLHKFLIAIIGLTRTLKNASSSHMVGRSVEDGILHEGHDDLGKSGKASGKRSESDCALNRGEF